MVTILSQEPWQLKEYGFGVHSKPNPFTRMACIYSPGVGGLLTTPLHRYCPLRWSKAWKLDTYSTQGTCANETARGKRLRGACTPEGAVTAQLWPRVAHPCHFSQRARYMVSCAKWDIWNKHVVQMPVNQTKYVCIHVWPKGHQCASEIADKKRRQEA